MSGKDDRSDGVLVRVPFTLQDKIYEAWARGASAKTIAIVLGYEESVIDAVVTNMRARAARRKLGIDGNDGEPA